VPNVDAFHALGDKRFVSLTTFRKTGAAVSSPVWIGRDGDQLIVTTPQDSGKVKRLRNSSRCELRPCSRSGKVPDGVRPIAAVAEIFDDDATRERATEIIRVKYGLEYRIIMRIERLFNRSGQKPRVILRLTPAS
jgi:PPOX class probable F420-dependent enzyme